MVYVKKKGLCKGKNGLCKAVTTNWPRVCDDCLDKVEKPKEEWR